MAVVINNQSGLAENLDDNIANNALKQGTHSVLLNGPEGDQVTANLEDLPSLMSQGYTHPSPEQYQKALDFSKYSSPSEQAKTFAEGLTSGATFGLSTGVERALGVNPKDIQARREVNPGMHGLGEFGGLFLPMGEGAVLSKAGKLAGEAVKGTGLLAKVGRGAAKGMAETALMQTGDEVSKMLSSDPEQSIGSALSNITLSGLVGGGVGGVIGSIHPLWEAAQGSKVAKGLGDFKGRILDVLNNPDEVTSATQEMQSVINQTDQAVKDAYGLEGNKLQRIEENLPEMHSGIEKQVKEILSDSANTVKDAYAEPDIYFSGTGSKIKALNGYTRRLHETLGLTDLAERASQVDNLNKIIEKTQQQLSDIPANVGFESMETSAKRTQLTNALETAQQNLIDLQNQPVKKLSDFNPIDIYKALNDYKKDIGTLSTWDPRMHPSEEKEASKLIKNLFFKVKEQLQDTNIWGEAGNIQKAANEQSHKWIGDFGLRDAVMKKFGTLSLDGKKVIDPGKINTFINQRGTPRAEIKTDVVNKLLDEIKGIHEVLGKVNGESLTPTPTPTLDMLRGDYTAGAKLADSLIKKYSGSALGSIAGAGIGHITGLGGVLGGLVGGHALGPFFDSVMPALLKPLLSNEVNATAAKEAIDYSINVAKGDRLLDKAAKAIFDKGIEAVPNHLIPKEKNIDKLEKLLKVAQENPQQLNNIGGNIAHYMPSHAVTIGATVGRAINYLSSLKPITQKTSPLDEDRTPSDIEKGRYNRALEIVEQPLMVMKHLKDGSLTHADLATIAQVHPGAYERMKTKLYEAIVNKQSKGEEIPYKTIQAASMFLGQPLKASLKPQNIALNQSTMQMPQTSQQGMHKFQDGRKEAALNKLTQSESTPAQAAERARSSRER